MVMGKSQRDVKKSSYFAEQPHTICMSTAEKHCRKISCQSASASVSHPDQKGENAIPSVKNSTDTTGTWTGMQANRTGTGDKVKER